MRTDSHGGFAALFGGSPTHVVTAPGRVNLIGEHIDYCGLPVLPIAIGRRIRLLFRPREDATVRMASTEAGCGTREFAADPDLEPGPSGDWGNYARAAARAVARWAGARRGFDGLVDSDLPIAAGLSSSSALVVACALALLESNSRELGPAGIDRRELARRLAAGERFVGVRGGGMDQAVCLLAREGHALRIAFDPLRTAPVPVPPSWRFVVAHSLERAPKSGSARELYNRRTEECAEALGAAAARLAGRTAAGGPPPAYARLLATQGLSALVALASELPEPLDRRFRHVVSEAARVDEAERALREEDLGRFGTVLLDGHRSLRDDYEVSTPSLDELVELAVEAGAAGARLTGAGLGGCVLVVCEADRQPAVLAGLEAGFYADRSFEGALRNRLFAVRPSEGARVEEVPTR